ncbi:MAG: KUP/HAK/KT family potassium transporter [Solirubrobacteraceae bacterium]
MTVGRPPLRPRARAAARPGVGALADEVALTTWDRGRAKITALRVEAEGPLLEFVEHMHRRAGAVQRLPGAAIYLNPSRDTTPLALRVGVDRLRAIPTEIVVVTVETTNTPYVAQKEQAIFDPLGYDHDGYSHITLRFGFQDKPDVPRALGLARRAKKLEVDFNPYHATYFLSHITIVATSKGGMPRWRKALFIAMARNAASPADYFHLPAERVVTLGSQIRF